MRHARTSRSALLVTFVLLFGYACKKDGPEDQIRKMIQRTAEAAENRELGGIMEGVSERFIGPYGLDKRETRRYIFAKLFRSEWRKVLVYDVKVNLTDEAHAEVKLKVFLARSEKIKTIEDLKTATRADAFFFTLDIVAEDGEWRVYKAKHRRLGANEIF